MASTINEKNPDSELAYKALLRGIQLFLEVADAVVVSPIIDIYPKKQKSICIKTTKSFIDRKIGVEIPMATIVSILTNLDFTVVTKGDELIITVPSHRVSDVTIPEDIVEEVARVYGYFAIPSILQPPAYVSQPKDTELAFQYQYIVKSYLKHKGYTEVMNYSAVSIELLNQFEQKEKSFLQITNSISEDIKYLRISLIPSLVKNVKQNEGFVKEMKLFEIAKTYIPTKSLPIEENRLTIATTNSFDELKAILIGLMKELNISYELKQNSDNQLLLQSIAGEVMIGTKSIGSFGQVKPGYCRNGGLDRNVYVADISFMDLISAARIMPDYKSFSQYAHITRDLTIPKKTEFSEIKAIAFKTSGTLLSLSLIGSYKNTITIRLEFTDHSKNIIESEVKDEVEKIKKALSS